MGGRDRTPAGLAKRLDRHGLDAEADRRQAGRVHRVDERRVESIEPRLALEAQIEMPRPDLVAERQAALTIVGEQRIAEDDVGPALQRGQVFELVDDVRRRPAAM